MLHLTRAIDRATGYIFVPAAGPEMPQGTIDDPNAPATARGNEFALFSSAAGPLKGPGSNVRDVQERWIDERERWDAYEKMQWRKEGELIKEAAAHAEAEAKKRTTKIQEGHSSKEAQAG